MHFQGVEHSCGSQRHEPTKLSITPSNLGLLENSEAVSLFWWLGGPNSCATAVMHQILPKQSGQTGCTTHGVFSEKQDL